MGLEYNLGFFARHRCMQDLPRLLEHPLASGLAPAVRWAPGARGKMVTGGHSCPVSPGGPAAGRSGEVGGDLANVSPFAALPAGPAMTPESNNPLETVSSGTGLWGAPRPTGGWRGVSSWAPE